MAYCAARGRGTASVQRPKIGGGERGWRGYVWCGSGGATSLAARWAVPPARGR